jgi:hypothetical protein
MNKEQELQKIYDRSYKKYLRRMSAFKADEAAAKIIYKVIGKRRVKYNGSK